MLIRLLDRSAPAPGVGWPRRLAPAFGVGWCFGFGYFVAGLWWLGAAFLADAGAFIWLMPAAVLALPAGLALFFGAGTAVARLFWPEGWPRLLIFATFLSLAEWLRGHVLTGFPWNAFGYALMPSPLFMQIASVVGLWGVTWLALLVFSSPVLLVGPRRARRTGDGTAFALVALAFASVVVFGAIRLSGAESATVPGVKLRLVQPAIAQDERWSPDRDEKALDLYLRLSATGMEEGRPPPFTLLVWPETALPFYLMDRPDALAAIGDLLPEGATLLTGAARHDAVVDEGDEPRVFNSIYLIDDSGAIRDAYDKMHLVPFGEYLPFEGTLRGFGLRQMVELPGGFDPGEKRRTLAPSGVPPFGPLICYEIIFPRAAVDPQSRPQWLLNVTNDGWFGDTPGPRQHLQQAIVRSVEEGLPLVRAANSGISAIVDPYGRMLESRALGDIGIVDGPLPASLGPTIYSRWGDSIYLVICILSLIVAATGSFTQAKHRN